MPSIMLQDKFEITDEDIDRAQKIFFPDGGTFSDPNNERVNFIKCIDKNLHVQACPGSGKTTALLAKLYLLAEKMPFENNRGICVLTHTNVAIDTIKKRLGDKVDRLLSYPNFFGTIQSFVDRYLAIPFYIKTYGYKPKFIDNEFFYNRLSSFERLSTNGWLRNNKGPHSDVFEFLIQEVQMLLQNGKFEIDFDKLKNRNSPTFKDINNFFQKIWKDGYLRFEDAFYLAEIYLNENQNLKNIFSSRFKYVFIDEAQDTSANQKEIMEGLFNENVIIQWIGDTNQAIMNDDYSESAWKPEGNKSYHVLEITDSKRISQPIADVIKTVAVKSYESLNGIQGIGLRPVIILFDDRKIDKVLPKFAELLIEKKAIFDNNEKTIWEISKLTGHPIKAVGWVGKEKNNGLSIPSYFKDFYNVSASKRKQHFPNLYTMYELSRNLDPKEFKDRVINCILESLYVSDITYNNKIFTKTSFYEFVSSTNENFLTELNTQIAKFYCDQESFDNFSGYVIGLLEDNLKLKLNGDSKKYLSEKVLMEVKQEQAENNNIFKHNHDGTEISFQIATVHSVKGETHTATLYLDTKFHKNSIKYIEQQLNGNSYNKKNEKTEKALKVTHVAFSRATHLLCIAVEKSSLNVSALPNGKFEIIDLATK